MVARKPAIQMTNGIDDIIKGGFKAAKNILKPKNFRGTQFPKNQSLTKKQFKRTFAGSEITKKDAKKRKNTPFEHGNPKNPSGYYKTGN